MRYTYVHTFGNSKAYLGMKVIFMNEGYFQVGNASLSMHTYPGAGGRHESHDKHPKLIYQAAFEILK